MMWASQIKDLELVKVLRTRLIHQLRIQECPPRFYCNLCQAKEDRSRGQAQLIPQATKKAVHRKGTLLFIRLKAQATLVELVPRSRLDPPFPLWIWCIFVTIRRSLIPMRTATSSQQQSAQSLNSVVQTSTEDPTSTNQAPSLTHIIWLLGFRHFDSFTLLFKILNMSSHNIDSGAFNARHYFKLQIVICISKPSSKTRP